MSKAWPAVCLPNRYTMPHGPPLSESCSIRLKVPIECLVKVDPRGTSQPCPGGKPAPKKLWNRLHRCSCGLNTTRDHASALEILRRGLRLRTETPAIAGVALEAPRNPSENRRFGAG